MGKGEKKQDSRDLENKCWKFLQPLLEQMHKLVDRRLVKTMLDLVMVILMHRNRNTGLLLSELGDYLLGGERGPAGVKRIASLLHSVKLESVLILNYLWKRGEARVFESGRIVSSTLNESCASETNQTRLFQSSH